MNETELVSRLVDANIFEYTEDGGSVKRTEEFDTAANDYEKSDTEQLSPDLLDIAENHDVVGELVVVNERLDTLSDRDAIRVLLVLLEFQRPQPPDAGVPSSFTPIHGDLLDLYVQLSERGIVYVWRHDCDPCDTIRGDFEELFPEPPDDLALFAVYGPDSARTLQEEWDVEVGPTTLFLRGGKVDARVLGAPFREKLENEIEAIRS